MVEVSVINNSGRPVRVVERMEDGVRHIEILMDAEDANGRLA